jgi:hypothetical protein
MPSQPEAEDGATEFDSIQDLVDVIELEDVVVHEERARRIQWDADSRDGMELPSYDNSLGIVRTPGRIEYRFRVVFTDEQAEYVSDVAALYSIPTDRIIGAALQLEFAQRVAFMTVYPFVRASVFGSAVRLGQPAPVMGIVRPGDFEPGEPMTDEAAREAFFDKASERATKNG